MKHVPRRFRPFGVPTFSTYSPMFQRILKPSAKKFRESPFFDPLGFVEIRILIHRNGIIHLHGSPWWPQAYDRPRGHRSKFVHTMHNYYFKGDFPAEDEVLFEQINKRALKSYGTADCVVVVAAWMKRFLADKIGNRRGFRFVRRQTRPIQTTQSLCKARRENSRKTFRHGRTVAHKTRSRKILRGRSSA